MTNFARNSPVHAVIEERYPLTKEDSSKQTWHVRLKLEKGITLDYLPGDSVGIYAQNDPLLVAHLIDALGVSGQESIMHKRSEQRMSLQTFFIHHANLSRLTSSFLQFFDHHKEIANLLLPENKPALRQFLQEKDPLHLLRDFEKKGLPVQEIVNQFGPLLPRFYSIASAKQHTPDHIDLTVALFTWMQDNEKRFGVASHFLCHLAQIDKTPIPLFVQPAPHFRLPSSLHTPIIMVGPGTGVAPFRAFIQERHAQEASGKQWLFFGERNQKSDFFYENEWEQFPKLQVDAAFSRDGDAKTYVQHKMHSSGKMLYDWIENGAYLYICGDAKVMAKDVEQTLLEIIAKYGNRSPEEAKLYLKSLKKQNRYCLDIY